MVLNFLIMARLPTLKQIVETPHDWDVSIYFLRKIRGQYVATKICSYAMFNESAVSMQRIANNYNKTNNYIFEYRRIRETD